MGISTFLSSCLRASLLLAPPLLMFEPVSAELMEALPRHANWGAALSPPAEGKAGTTIRSVVADGFAASLGLRAGDVILEVNGVRLLSTRDHERVFRTTGVVRGGSRVTLEVLRDGRPMRRSGTLPARRLESFPGVTTEYRSVLSPHGYRVQVIVTRPAGVKGRIPGIFLVRWMSCDPVEKPTSPKHGVQRLLEDFVQKSGYAVMRVEKPGLGDSEGPPCYDADFQHELAAHRAAFDAFRGLAFVDSSRIAVFAQSNGAAYAPLVGGDRAAAYVVTGGWVKTWYEHMLEYQRRTFELDGNEPSEITRKMKLVEELYAEYLLGKQIPGRVVEEKPHLREVWDGEVDHQWDLPVAYMQQLQDLDVAAAWARVRVPTYVFYGGYDFGMVEADHHEIVGLVNRNGSGLAHYEFVPRMHHSLFWFDDLQDARTDFYGKGVYREDLGDRILDWLRRVLGPVPASTSGR